MAENLERKITTEMLNDSYTGKGTYTLGSGSEYVGEFKDGYIHGKGTWTYKSGSKYVGELKKDKKHGKGTYSWANGDKYVGEYKDGNFNGKGTFTWANGNKYEGDWVDDKQNGKGTYTASDGDKYEGEWENDERHGKGVYTVANGPVVTGNFINGLVEGYAVMDFLDGEKYEGEWVKNKKEGEGTYSWANGNKYVGEWKNGKQNGKGIYTYASGAKHIGEYKDDDKNGKGTFTWADGNKYEGDWVDDKQNGKGTYTWVTGDKYEGDWKDNLHNAKGVYTDKKKNKYTNLSSIYIKSVELANKILEHSNIKIDFKFKLDLLQDSSIKVDVLESMSKDKEDYNSSILRKSIALHSKTPISIINNLLEDDYRWVREAAASHSVINKQMVKELMKTKDRYILKGLLVNPNTDKKDKDKISELIEDYPIEYDSYSINTYSYGIVEDVSGSVDIDSVVEAIMSGEDNWSSYIYSEFYQYNDYYHNYLPVTLVDTVVFPDSSESDIYVDGKYLCPFVDISSLGSVRQLGEDTFFHHATSHESGTWEYASFELEYEFQSKYLIAIFEDEAFTEGLILRYEYDNPGNDDYIEEIDGELAQSGGKGIDIELYVNTKDGVVVCDDFCDILYDMKEEGENTEDKDSVKEFLKKRYDLSTE